MNLHYIIFLIWKILCNGKRYHHTAVLVDRWRWRLVRQPGSWEGRLLHARLNGRSSRLLADWLPDRPALCVPSSWCAVHSHWCAPSCFPVFPASLADSTRKSHPIKKFTRTNLVSGGTFKESTVMPYDFRTYDFRNSNVGSWRAASRFLAISG